MFKVLLLVLMIATLLSEWGYNTTTILASLGVGGIAIALAAQKTIENFFERISAVTDRPVAVGDVCKLGDRSGTVRGYRIEVHANPHAGSDRGHSS